MPRGTQLSDYEKGVIDGLREQKMTYQFIGTFLNRSFSVVRNYLNNKENYGSNRRSGRRPLLSDRAKSRVIRYAKNTQFSRSKIANDLNLKVSKWTIGRALKSDPNIKRKKKKQRPALKDHHKVCRLNWAKKVMSWTNKWKNIVFTDEKKFNLDGPDGYHYYWHDLRTEEQYYSKRVCGGGSVMVWAGVGFNGKTNIAMISGKMKSKEYIDLLNTHLLTFAAKIGGKNWILQQDNCPIHTSNETKQWLQSKNINVLDWPALSPDLNIIENVWGSLVRSVYANGRQFNTVAELKLAINSAWEELSVFEIKKLVNSSQPEFFKLLSRMEAQQSISLFFKALKYVLL
jgi:hypothetical protein